MTAHVRVDGARLARTVETLGAIGAGPDGLHRLAFTVADREGRAYVTSLMRDASLDVRVDPAGNVIGRREGTARTGGALASGSHIDTVPGGGRYDGAYGVLAAIEVARALADSGARLAHALEVIAFADEEGTRVPGGLFGSRAMAGALDAQVAAAARSDAHLAADMSAAGADPQRLAGARRSPGEIAAYVELHVEQGPVLAARGVPIGVVTGVTGRFLLQIEVTGFANHAGTTPMDARRDALVAAARMVLAARDLGEAGTCRTVTVGMLAVEPGAANVVPGRVTLSVDARDMERGRIERAETLLRERAALVAAADGVAVTVTRRSSVEPAPADARVRRAVADAARALGLATIELPSGAGHDAQAVAAIAPIGMIFVPSAEGVSHAGMEYTAPADCENGANVLLATLVALDKEV